MKFLLKVIGALLLLTGLLSVLMVVAGSGRLADVPIVWLMLFLCYGMFGVVVEIGIRIRRRLGLDEGVSTC